MEVLNAVDLRLLLLSAAISLVAAYAAMDVTERVRAARGGQFFAWLTCGAIAVGVSFWGMQYIGMLAYGLPDQTHFYTIILALSRIVAVGVAAVSIAVGALSPLQRGTRFAASVLIGIGIVAVHLTSIAAMAAPRATIDYRLPSIALAVLIAIVTVWVALAIIVRVRSRDGVPAFALRLLGALTIGLGILGVHVLGMLSATLAISSSPRLPINPDDYLVAVVAIVAFALSFAAIGASMFDRRLRHERERFNELEDRYSRERRLALALQRALLPVSLPHIEGLRFSTSYVPSTVDDGIGGDWFDAFALADGRVAVSIGDAAGHGTAAAIAMNVVRQAFRNAAEDSTDPTDVMHRANRVLLHSGTPSLVTAIFGVLDPASLDFVYACAGHPPPLLAHADGTVTTLPGSGTGLPIGIFEEYEVATQTTRLPTNSIVALYTDGFIEHSRDIVAGMHQLRNALADQVRSENRESARAIDAAIFGTQPRTDDAAILTISPLATINSVDRHYPPELETAPRARAAVRRFLDGIALPDERVFDILVAVGEAVSNAIEHAYVARDGAGAIRVRMHAAIDHIEVAVDDRGTWREPTAQTDRGRGITIMRSLADRFSLEESAEGTCVRLRFARPARGG